MINNGIIEAPVTITDVSSVTGQSTTNLSRLIISARSGGSNNGSYKQAFWTKQHCPTGTEHIGKLIDGSTPYFNIFSFTCPVIWENSNGNLTCRLKNSANLSDQSYSFSLGDFGGYDHNELSCELVTLPDFVSFDTTKLITMDYKIPLYFFSLLPEITKSTFIVLSANPPETNGNTPFYAVANMLNSGTNPKFQVYLQDLPQYKGESKVINWYVSVWDWTDDTVFPVDLRPVNYTFRYRMFDTGTMYSSATTVTGGKNPTIPMYINLEVEGTVGEAYYERINNARIRVHIKNLKLTYDSKLYSWDNAIIIGTIPAGQYQEFIQEYPFPEKDGSYFAIVHP